MLSRAQMLVPCRRRTIHSGVRLQKKIGSIRELIEKSQEYQQRSELNLSQQMFEQQQQKNKETFNKAIDIFVNRDHRRRGSVEFIKAALGHMKYFGVHKDLETYKALISVMPQGPYLPDNRIQAMFMHYPKQQDCILEALDKMEMNRVVPDEELGQLIQNMFSMYSKPYRKYCRMRYWMPKLRHVSPCLLPDQLPSDGMALAKLAIQQITSVDRLTELQVFDTHDIPESLDKTWIVSGQSPAQREMISRWPKNKTLFVEGGFRVWLKDSQVTYFVLRGEAVPWALASSTADNIDANDMSHFTLWTFGQLDPRQNRMPYPKVHEQQDGSIMACCATGTSARDSLLSWIRFLQKDNPDLANIPILFTLHSPLGPVEPLRQEELNLMSSKPS